MTKNKCDVGYLAESLHNGNYSEVKEALNNQCSKSEILDFVEAYAHNEIVEEEIMSSKPTYETLKNAIKKTRKLLE
jgi:hypothetical protein